MTSLSVHTLTTTYSPEAGYLVTLEWDCGSGSAAPDTLTLHLFAQGAASLREDGPVGNAAIVERCDIAESAIVFVECLHIDGPKF